jgi:hypothetical protein
MHKTTLGLVLTLTADQGPPPLSMQVTGVDQMLALPMNLVVQWKRNEQGKVDGFTAQLGPG